MDAKTQASAAQRLTDLPDAPALWRSAFKQSENWMRPGIASLENVQAVAQTWTQHRLEDFERAMETLRQIAESKDFVQAAAIQQKWLADCTQRLVADWTALVTATTRQSAELGRDLKKAAE